MSTAAYELESLSQKIWTLRRDHAGDFEEYSDLGHASVIATWQAQYELWADTVLDLQDAQTLSSGPSPWSGDNGMQSGGQSGMSVQQGTPGQSIQCSSKIHYIWGTARYTLDPRMVFQASTHRQSTCRTASQCNLTFQCRTINKCSLRLQELFLKVTHLCPTTCQVGQAYLPNNRCKIVDLRRCQMHRTSRQDQVQIQNPNRIKACQ